MWPFAKKRSKLPVVPFKTNEGFFQYWCKWGENTLVPERPLLGIVLDGKEIAEVGESVKTRPDGIQTAMMRIVSADGGFDVIAQTIGPGDALAPSDLVMWLPGRHMSHLANKFADPRTAWAGFIVAKVAPELDFETNQFRVLAWYRIS